MQSMTVILCGFLFVPGADPIDSTHDVYSGYNAQPGQVYDPYGVYAHLRQAPQPTPYHVVRHDLSRSPQIARMSPQMQTPAHSPYQLVEQPRPVTNLAPVLAQKPKSAVPLEMIACTATFRATSQAGVVRAEYRLPEKVEQASEIQQIDFRLPITQPLDAPPEINPHQKYLFPVPEWGWERPLFESALDQQQSKKR